MKTKLAPGLWSCAYCHSIPVEDAKVPRGQISHGLCTSCSVEMEKVTMFRRAAIKQCPGCCKNVGVWMTACIPCGGEKQ